MNEKQSIAYKIVNFIGGLLVCFTIIMFLIGITYFLITYIDWYKIYFISIIYIFEIRNYLFNYWFNPDWLNNNEGLLAGIGLFIQLLVYFFSFNFFTNWKKEYNKKVENVSDSIFIVSVSLIKTRIELKKMLLKCKEGEVATKPKIFNTYFLIHSINYKFQTNDRESNEMKIYIVNILENLDIINQIQQYLLTNPTNKPLLEQQIHDMERVLILIEETLPQLESIVRKYEYIIKDWRFNKDPTFLSLFTKDELTIKSI